MMRKKFSAIASTSLILLIIIFEAHKVYEVYKNIYILILFLIGFPLIYILNTKWFVIGILKKDIKIYYLAQLIGGNFLVIYYAVLCYKMVEIQLSLILISGFLIYSIYTYLKQVKNGNMTK